MSVTPSSLSMVRPTRAWGIPVAYPAAWSHSASQGCIIGRIIAHSTRNNIFKQIFNHALVLSKHHGTTGCSKVMTAYFKRAFTISQSSCTRTVRPKFRSTLLSTSFLHPVNELFGRCGPVVHPWHSLLLLTCLPSDYRVGIPRISPGSRSHQAEILPAVSRNNDQELE